MIGLEWTEAPFCVRVRHYDVLQPWRDALNRTPFSLRFALR